MFEKLKSNRTEWKSWHYTISNVATAFAMSEKKIMEKYSLLVEDIAVRDRIFALINQEHDRTRTMLEDYFGGPLDIQRPLIAWYMNQRSANLGQLHELQIRMLKNWRTISTKNPELSDQDEHLLPLLLCINAIASGLGGTG